MRYTAHTFGQAVLLVGFTRRALPSNKKGPESGRSGDLTAPTACGFGRSPSGALKRPAGTPRQSNRGQLRVDAKLLEYRLDL